MNRTGPHPMTRDELIHHGTALAAWFQRPEGDTTAPPVDKISELLLGLVGAVARWEALADVPEEFMDGRPVILAFGNPAERFWRIAHWRKRDAHRGAWHAIGTTGNMPVTNMATAIFFLAGAPELPDA